MFASKSSYGPQPNATLSAPIDPVWIMMERSGEGKTEEGRKERMEGREGRKAKKVKPLK